MQMTEDIRQLQERLMDDSKYASIVDRYERMQYLLCHHDKLLSAFSQRTLERCNKYERIHSKLESVLSAEDVVGPTADGQSSMSNLFSHHLKCTRDLIDKHKNGGGLADLQFFELWSSSNLTLRYSPVDWKDLTCMLTLLEIYVQRAAVEYDRQTYRSALSDLRHASSILEYAHAGMLLDHFKDAQQHPQDYDLLLMMLSLKRKLLTKVYQVNASNPASINASDDVESVLDEIRQLDSLLQKYATAQKQFPKMDNSSVNYWLNTKARLGLCPTDGRIIVAQDAIAQGEPIMMEQPYSVVTFQKFWFNKCNYCHLPMETFWPCVACDEVGYCSARCSMLAYGEYHRYECGIYGLIMRSNGVYSMPHTYRLYARFGLPLALDCEEEELANKYSGYFTDPSEYFASETLRTVPFRKQTAEDRVLLCRTITSLLTHRGHHTWPRECAQTVNALALAHMMMYKGLLKMQLVKEQPEKYARLVEHIANALQRAATNGFCWMEYKAQRDGLREPSLVGSCQSLIAAFFNHSCVNNVNWLISAGGVIRLVATRSIAQGEPLTLSYGPKQLQPFAVRQTRLRMDYCFFCRCEACIQDASSGELALRCQAPGGVCDGPLLLSPFLACLKCGYPKHPSQKTFDADSLAHQVQTYSRSFMDIIHKMHSQAKGSNTGGLLSKFVPDIFSRNGKQQLTSEDMLFDIILSMPFKRSSLTPKRITKLENYFLFFSAASFGGSYLLLGKATLLLKVYAEAKCAERGLQLLGQLDQCLATIFPALTNAQHIKLVYALDYVAHFFEQLISNREHCLPDMFAQVNNLPPYSFDSKMVYETFWAFYGRLNGKLAAILKYDIEQRGDFFPTLHQALKQQKDQSNLDSNTKLEPSSNEQTFFTLLTQCQRRLVQFETAIGAAQQ